MLTSDWRCEHEGQFPKEKQDEGEKVTTASEDVGGSRHHPRSISLSSWTWDKNHKIDCDCGGVFESKRRLETSAKKTNALSLDRVSVDCRLLCPFDGVEVVVVFLYNSCLSSFCSFPSVNNAKRPSLKEGKKSLSSLSLFAERGRAEPTDRLKVLLGSLHAVSL